MTTWHVYNSLTGEQRLVASNDLPEHFFTLRDDQLAYTFVWKEGWADWEALVKVPELMAFRKKVPAPPPRGMRASVLPDDEIETSESKSIPMQTAAPTRSMKPTRPPVQTQTVNKISVETSAQTSASASNQPSNQPSLMTEPIEAVIPVKRDAGSQMLGLDVPTLANPILIPKKIEEPVTITDTETGADRRLAERLTMQLNVIITVDNTVIRSSTIDISRTGISLEDPIPESMLRKPLQLYISTPDSRQKLKMEATLVGDLKNAKRFRFHEPSAHQLAQIDALLDSVKLIKAS